MVQMRLSEGARSRQESRGDGRKVGDVRADAAERTITRLREILRAGGVEPIEEAAARLVMFHDGSKEIIAKARTILGAHDVETLIEAAERVMSDAWPGGREPAR